jgi:hypothetical protein
LRKLNKIDPKGYWTFWNSINRNKDIKTPNLQEFRDYFEKNNKPSENSSYMADETDMNYENEILNSQITHSEISKAIIKWKNGKAYSRSDSISNEYIKSTKNIILPIYVKLFNKILDTGIIPSTWSEGYIIPVYKGKGSKLSPENYRPITNLSFLYKIFTCVLNDRLTSLLKQITWFMEIKLPLEKICQLLIMCLHWIFS